MKNRQTPSVLFLIAVNALVLFGVTTIGISNPRAFMVTILVFFLPLFLAALAGQVLVYRLLRGRRITDGMRAFLYLVPVILVVFVAPFLAPSSSGTSPDSPLPSPSAEYLLEVPIRKASWTVRILDREGRPLHEDAASEFYGRFNSSWRWDADDRAWLLNGDTGEIHFWEQVDGKWKKQRWGTVSGREIARPLEPPAELFADDVAGP